MTVSKLSFVMLGMSVSASGLCWSRTSNLPTIADDTTQGSTSIAFSPLL